MAKSDAGYRERQQRWLNHLEAATASGETLASYAKAHGLKVADVYRWKKRLSARGVWPRAAKPIAMSGAFVPVSMSPPASATTQCTVTFPNGIRLEFTSALDASQLQALFTSVGSLS